MEIEDLIQFVRNRLAYGQSPEEFLEDAIKAFNGKFCHGEVYLAYQAAKILDS